MTKKIQKKTRQRSPKIPKRVLEIEEEVLNQDRQDDEVLRAGDLGDLLNNNGKYFREVKGSLPRRSKRSPFEENVISGAEWVDVEEEDAKTVRYLTTRPKKLSALGRKSETEDMEERIKEVDIEKMHHIEEELENPKKKKIKKTPKKKPRK